LLERTCVIADPIDDAVATVPEDRLGGLAADLAKVLETQRARIEYAESRRGSLAAVGGVLLAAGLAGTVQIASNDSEPGRYGHS
jgi:hypothetical protein